MSPKRPRGRPRHDDVLTPTEWRVVHAVTHGMTRRQIAEGRGIGIAGVKYHLANVTAKLGLDGRVALRHWFAVPKGSALARQLARREGQTMTTKTSVALGRIGQISRSADVKRSEAWYRDVLGLPHLYTFGPLAFFDCAGTRLALMQKETPSKDESIVSLAVDELVPAVDALKAAACASSTPRIAFTPTPTGRRNGWRSSRTSRAVRLPSCPR